MEFPGFRPGSDRGCLRAIMVPVLKTSPKALVPAVCFAVFAYLAWQVHGVGGEFRLAKDYKVEIIVHGPDGKIIPALGRAPQ
jgi:hypothetical protein